MQDFEPCPAAVITQNISGSVIANTSLTGAILLKMKIET
jgi:hypothetical protein